MSVVDREALNPTLSDLVVVWHTRKGFRRLKPASLADVVAVLREQGATVENRCRDHPCQWCGTSTVAVGAGCCAEPVLVYRLDDAASQSDPVKETRE